MPLTVSHAAAALPLRRLRLPLSALIMGAMAPDFEFFLRMSHQRVIGHTINGLPLFCLPVGLAGLLIFHRLLKYPLLSLLPSPHQAKLRSRAGEFRFLPLSRLAGIVLAVLIGSVSHILWDALTHDGSWFTERIGVLGMPVVAVKGRFFKVCDLLQHLSSALGFFALVHAYRRWYLRTPPVAEPTAVVLSRPARIAVCGAMSGFGCVGGLVAGFGAQPFPPRDLGLAQSFIATTVVSGVSVFLAAWVAYSLVWHLFGSRLEPE